MLIVTFSTGEKRLFDATQLHGGMLDELADDSVFDTLRVDYGTLTWKQGEIDIAPETVYHLSLPYTDKATLEAMML